MNKEKFTLAQILSIAKDMYLCRDMKEINKLNNFLMGKKIQTYQFSSSLDITSLYVLEIFPQLKEANVEGINEENYDRRFEALINEFGDEFELEPIPKEFFEKINNK